MQDRKDFVIEALVQQRDDAMIKALTLYADAKLEIARQAAEITDLKTQLAKRRKKKVVDVQSGN